MSATLGELEKVPELLRPDKRLPCETVTDSNSTATLQVQVKGYLERVPEKGERAPELCRTARLRGYFQALPWQFPLGLC